MGRTSLATKCLAENDGNPWRALEAAAEVFAKTHRPEDVSNWARKPRPYRGRLRSGPGTPEHFFWTERFGDRPDVFPGTGGNQSGTRNK